MLPCTDTSRNQVSEPYLILSHLGRILALHVCQFFHGYILIIVLLGIYVMAGISVGLLSSSENLEDLCLERTKRKKK